MLRAAVFVIFSILAAAPASAQEWPSKPVCFIVPFPPGGSVDPLARLLGAKLGDALKQQFIVENRPGAGGFRITHAPFAGGGPMNQNILGGQIDMGIGSVALLSPQVKSGKMRAIATTGDKRASALPDVPTLIEQGFPGLTAYAWWGLYAPTGTPKPIIDRFHAELVKVLNQADVRKTLAEGLGMDLVVSTPDELQKWTLAELAKWGRIVRDNNIKTD